MTLELSARDMVSKMLAIILAIICYVAFFDLHDPRLNYIAAFTCCIFLLLRSVKDKFLFVFYLFISSYLFFLYPHYIKGYAIQAYSFDASIYHDKTLFTFSLFLVSMLFFFKHMPIRTLNERLEVRDNAFIFYMNLVFQVAIIIFGTSGTTIFEQTYGSNQVEISTINNYYSVFYIASFVTSGRQRNRMLLLNTVALLYCANSLALGGRGATISMALVYYLLVLDKRVSFFQFALLILLGFVFMTFWNFVRSGHTAAFFSAAEGGGLGAIFGVTSSAADKYTMQGGHYTDIFYATSRILAMTDTGVIDLGDRVYAFALFIASIAVPYSILPPIANLASYLVGDYMTLGGGMAFAYFYTFLSYFGVILLAFLINLAWNKLRGSKNKYALVYCILVFAFMNGWFAYNPITLFKLCLWGAGYIFFMDVLTANLTRKK